MDPIALCVALAALTVPATGAFTAVREVGRADAHISAPVLAFALIVFTLGTWLDIYLWRAV